MKIDNDENYREKSFLEENETKKISNEADKKNIIPLKNSEGIQQSLNDINSQEGSVVVIHNEPQRIEENDYYTALIYFFMIFISESIVRVIAGIFIIQMFNGSKLDITNLVLLMMGYYSWKIVMNLFFYIKFGSNFPEFKTTYVFEIIYSSSFVFLYWALYMAIKGNIDSSSLRFFVLPHILLMLIRLIAGHSLNTSYLPSAEFAVFESLQILYIAFKLSDPSSHANWYIVMMFYLVIVYILIVLGVLTLIFGLIALMVVLFGEQQVPPFMIFLGIGGFAYLITMILINFLLVTGVIPLLEAGSIGINPGNHTTGENRVLVAGYLLLITGILSFLFLIFGFIFLRNHILQILNKNKISQISLMNLKNIKLNMSPSSENYFKKKKEGDEAGVKYEEMKCLICMDQNNEIILNPCNHTGLCKDCTTDLIKHNPKCPICREQIQKAFVIYYDEEKKDYFTNGMITFK